MNSKQYEMRNFGIGIKTPKPRYRFKERVESAELNLSKGSQVDSAQQTSRRDFEGYGNALHDPADSCTNIDVQIQSAGITLTN